jgi:hypothetical protein
MRWNRTSMPRRWRSITTSITKPYITNANNALKEYPQLAAKPVEEWASTSKRQPRNRFYFRDGRVVKCEEMLPDLEFQHSDTSAFFSEVE